ncbi:unnamed protein product [Spirodela intermedia]|uniref:Uncharacterized protein n=1 Tax=Spirodela intermedia TaxID=51605 RepID=A0A7I8JVL7_SPIIN|nr:unnamed protein product [Spirodela intermedia]
MTLARYFSKPVKKPKPRSPL